MAKGILSGLVQSLCNMKRFLKTGAANRQWLPTRGLARRRVLAGLLAGVSGLPVFGNPVGMNVVQGNASAVQNGSRLDISVSRSAYINWQSFNIGKGDVTTFHQPSATSVVWNRILDANPSQIWGQLNANGVVVLMNQNGFYFGPNSFISVGGFIATTIPVSPSVALGSGQWQFQGPPPAASIVNYGQIRANSGGSLFLVAEKIENHGILSAPDGTLGLYAGKEVLISERPDGRGLSASVRLPEGSIDNTGAIIADAGTVALHAQVVNQGGLIQANSVQQRQGVIELVASDSVNLGPASIIQAKGDNAAPSSGGRITIKSGQNFSDQTGSQIDVSGGAKGGNGGSLEISAVNFTGFYSHLNGTAQSGWQGGALLFDPYDITLANDGPDSPVASGDAAAVYVSDRLGASLRLNVNQAFKTFSQIRLQATHNILLYLTSSDTIPDTTWNLNNTTGISDAGSLLRLEAGTDIVFSANSHLIAGTGWTVQLAAGVNFSAFNRADFSLAGDFSKVPLLKGIGGIYLGSGNGSIETAEGDIGLRAGHEVLVGMRAGHDVLEPLPSGKDMLEGYGFIRTVGGGNISVTTLDGDVDSGNKDDGYVFSRFGYYIGSAGLGGIGTTSGGNVSIDAGGDILALHAPIGAFGTGSDLNSLGQSLAPGDVSLAAGRDIKGHFMLRDGVGTMRASRDVGAFGSTVTLGLVAGSWDIMAGYDATVGRITPGHGDIYLNEVYNPRGSLSAKMRFDYASDASVSLKAGHSVQLLGKSLANNGNNADRAAIYPGRLEIEAGAGGVVLGNDLVLYPSTSPTAGLSIHTTDGGSLHSLAGGIYQLVVSDSGSTDYHTFLNGHAAIPLHLNSPSASVTLDISGNLENLFVRSPSRADIVIWGHAANFSFEGLNLSPDDGKDNALRNPFQGTPGGDAGKNYSGIWIKGDYSSRLDWTFVHVSDIPNMSVFLDSLLTSSDLGLYLRYNKTTGILGFQGIMTDQQHDTLLHPLVYVLDPRTGKRALDAGGGYVTAPAVFTTDTAAIDALLANSQDIPTSGLAGNGLTIGGPGHFEVAAHTLDLGASKGIRSVGPFFDGGLVKVDPSVYQHGADLDVILSGDLTMASSQIASLFGGGNVKVTALQGHMDVGSTEKFVSDDTAVGIYSVHGGNVTVEAGQDIMVNGSRIATFGGGNVSVISDNGTVDAGKGVNIKFSAPSLQLNATTGELEPAGDVYLFGSGITSIITDRNSTTLMGDIYVRAAVDIKANSGGIVQFAFNGGKVDFSKSKVDLIAGRDIDAGQSGVVGNNVNIHAGRDVTGQVVASGNANITAVQNVNVTAIAAGTATVSGDKVTGSVISGGDANVSGKSGNDASVISTKGAENSTGGSGTGKVGAFTGAAAPVATKTTEDADKTVAKTADKTDDDESKKKKPIQLAKTVGRVTVILPKK